MVGSMMDISSVQIVKQGSDTMMQAAKGELYYYSNHLKVVLSNFRLTSSTNNKQKASDVTRSLLH